MKGARRAPDRAGGGPASSDRNGFPVAAAVGLGLGAAALALAGIGFAGAYRFAVQRWTLPIPRLRAPVRVVMLCDLHYGTYVGLGSVRRWVAAAIAEDPDVIVVGGDFVDRSVPTGPLVAALAPLPAHAPTVAVWGNHDRASAIDLDGFGSALGRVGIDVLVNRGADVGDVHVAGIDDVLTGRPDLEAALASRPDDRPTLLLSHNPDVLPQVPRDVDLTLSGHTHGGQVVAPIFGPLITGSRYGQRYASGWVAAPALGYVSRGLGVTAAPLRLNCPAELTRVDLVPSEGGAGVARSRST